VYTNIGEFERASLSREHRIVTDLFMTTQNGAASGLHQRRLEELVFQTGDGSMEDTRLWKRLYALARRLQSPLLLRRALLDLDRLPGAELPILAYLGALGWRGVTKEAIAERYSGGAVDTLSLGLLRSLLGSLGSAPSWAQPLLRQVLEPSENHVHPFCTVLAFACLSQILPPRELASYARLFLHSLPALQSAMARRVGVELLWQMPDLRRDLTKLVDEDRSASVRSLRKLVRRTTRRSTGGTSIHQSEATDLRRWGGLDIRLAHQFGLV
jgi:hypothetical protein